MKPQTTNARSPLVDQLLRENGYRLIRMPESGNNIFGALSHLLYFTEINGERLRQLAIEGVKIHFMSSLPRNKPLLDNCDVSRYVSNPRLPQFEPVTLDIIAELFNIKIKLYYINELNLCSDTYNSAGQRSFKLFRVHDFHYEPVITRRKLSVAILVQDVVLGIVENSINKTKGKSGPFNNNNLINLALKRWNNQTVRLPFCNKAALYSEADLMVKNMEAESHHPDEENIKTAIENFEEMYNELLMQNQESNDHKDSKDSIEQSFDELTCKVNVNQIFEDERRSCGINFYEEVPIKDFGSINSDTDIGHYHTRRQMIDKGIDSDDEMQMMALSSPGRRKNSERGYMMQNTEYHNNMLHLKERYNDDWETDGFNNKQRQYGYPPHFSSPISSRKVSIEENKTYTGVFKFFDEKNNFGFITLIDYPTVDVFVFGSEFQKAKIPLSVIKAAKYGHVVKFQFEIVFYWGRHGKSKKAVNIRLM